MQNETSFKRYAVSVTVGALFGLVFALLALFIVSALVLSGKLSDGASGVVISIVVAIGAVIGGVIAMRRGAYGVLIAGPSAGVLLYLFLTMLRMMFFGQLAGGEGALANIVAAIAGGSIGALLASKKRKVKMR